MERSELLRCRRRMKVAEGYLLLDMPRQALGELNTVRDVGRSLVDWHRLRGEALRWQQRHAEALEAFRHVEEAEPEELGTLLAIAWCYKRVDQLGDAIETMRRAYEAHPREPIVLYNIACYFSLAGEKAQALSWLGRAIRMEPKLRALIPNETDFDSLRNDPDFQFVVSDPTETLAE